ncbi:MAG: type II secretion system secretin GspD [Sandaracinaceae bacterium]|nr:type II secretion system secretin GspD [Sandaracinaceae bacterium]
MTHRLVVLTALLVTTAGTAHAQNQTATDGLEDPPPVPAPFETGLEGRAARPRRGERVAFNLEDGDLMDLVRMMTTITGYRFIITGSVRELHATVAASGAVTPGDAYRAFLAILNMNGLTVVRRGPYHVITDSGEVARRPTALMNDRSLPASDDRFVTWIHHVRHMPVAEASQLLDGLRSNDGRLIPYEPTRTLIVIDTGANIHRMRGVLAAVDVAQSNTHVWVEPVHFANAAELVTTLGAIFAEDEAAAPAPATRRRPAQAAQATAAAAPSTVASIQHAPIRFLADERTNSLLIIGIEPEYRRAIQLMRELDRRDREASASVRVRRLQHGDAEAVATTLQTLLGGPSGTASAAGASGAASAAIEGLHNPVRVEAHPDLNALVITATPADYRAISLLVDELDVAPRQVFLEMVLMELGVDDQDSLGLDLLGGIGGLFGENLVGALANIASSTATSGLGGTTLRLTGPNVPGTSIPSFGVQMQALSSNVQTNVISTPYVLALDNREAIINIGQNIPLQGSSVPGVPSLLSSTLSADQQQALAGASALSAASGGGGRRDTGTIVTVTPHINDDGEVRLEIQAEDSREGSRVGNLDASVISQSVAQTELVARDGQTVVMGGMIRDSLDSTQSGLPVLSQIPIIGALFGQHTTRTQRRNLLFFITPHVIRGPADVRAIFERRLRERREFLERHMAFEGDWEPPIDYTRTRGLVAEILNTVAEVRADAEAAAIRPDPDPEHVPRAPLGEDLDEEGEDLEEG